MVEGLILFALIVAASEARRWWRRRKGLGDKYTALDWWAGRKKD